MSTVSYEHVTKDQLRVELDRSAHSRYGLTVDEFLDRYRRGEIDTESVEGADLVFLARLLEPSARVSRERRSFKGRLWWGLRGLKRDAPISARAAR